MVSSFPAIEVRKVRKAFRSSRLTSHVALDSVSFSVPQGEIFGFLGPNGSGKTTLIKILAGISRPDKGMTTIFGENSQTRHAKLKLGYLPERPYIHEFLTADEFLRFHGRLLGLEPDAVSVAIPRLLERVDLKQAREQKLGTFSKGMLQRIGVAQALLHDPAVLILDEPMSGLDPVGRREIRDIISETAKAGKTIFFSTHIIHDVEVICSAVGFIQKGKLKGAGNIDDLLGRTIQSMEIRFSLPAEKDARKLKALKSARRTMDGWVLEVESEASRLDDEVAKVLEGVLSEEGRVRGVIPRKSTLEDIFYGEAKK